MLSTVMYLRINSVHLFRFYCCVKEKLKCKYYTLFLLYNLILFLKFRFFYGWTKHDYVLPILHLSVTLNLSKMKYLSPWYNVGTDKLQRERRLLWRSSISLNHGEFQYYFLLNRRVGWRGRFRRPAMKDSHKTGARRCKSCR